MKGTKEDLIEYRISRAHETLEDARILPKKGRWNSVINRLYYAAFYAVIALLLFIDKHSSTHSGTMSNFNQYFIKPNLIDKSFGKVYSELFSSRHKGDYGDLFDFDEERLSPFFDPVQNLIQAAEKFVAGNSDSDLNK